MPLTTRAPEAVLPWTTTPPPWPPWPTSCARAATRCGKRATVPARLRQAARRPSLVLLDVQLPDADGLDLCRRIKADPATASVPVLIVSGVATAPADRARGVDGGADGYLVKPVDPDELLAHVRALLRARRAEEAVLRRDGMLRRAEEMAHIAGWTYDLRTGVVVSSEEGCRICGTSPGPHRPDELMSSVHPEDAPLLQSAMRAAEGGASFELEHRQYVGGRVRWMSVRAEPERDSDDRVARVVGVTQDVTERKALEARFLQAQKMEAVGRLAGGRGPRLQQPPLHHQRLQRADARHAPAGQPRPGPGEGDPQSGGALGRADPATAGFQPAAGACAARAGPQRAGGGRREDAPARQSARMCGWPASSRRASARCGPMPARSSRC